MPAEWEDEFWNSDQSQLCDGDSKKKGNGAGITLRPPLYNAEDYIAALKLLFSSHCHPHPSAGQTKVKGQIPVEHAGQMPLTSGQGQQGSPKSRNDREFPVTPPEMTMRKFLNGSELLFKLEADLRHAYPTFVQEFVSVHCEGVLHTLEALKLIQTALDEVNGLREQRKLFMDEQKCLQCLRLCLRNIEAVSKLSTYPGGLYPIAAATVSTVTATRIIALEILTCICSEGGSDGHFKVSEAISTLRLRLGEPIRCKLLIGAISSAAPGAFQARGVRFLTAWVASAPSPRHKVHIQCELEEAGFSPAALRRGAELGGAREARQVQGELDSWDRVSIDVDTLTRQNSQLRNSVATLQQELATLKDKLKRMDPYPPKAEEVRRRTPKPKRTEELATTPADSEEEAEQIHQILEDLNNIVNSELNLANEQKSSKPKSSKTIESDIVPVHLVHPPKKASGKQGPMSPLEVTTRPWPGSSASDDDDESDLAQTPSPKMNPKADVNESSKTKNVRKVVQALENTHPKLYFKHGESKVNSGQRSTPGNSKRDYQLLNFHKQNHMANKFANFKSSKLYASSPDNSCSAGQQQDPPPSPSFYQSEGKKTEVGGVKGLRRSESLHTSLVSIPGAGNFGSPFGSKSSNKSSPKGQSRSKSKGQAVVLDKWKSVDDLDMDDNFTLRWKYPNAELNNVEVKAFQDKVKGKSSGRDGGGRIFELFNDYRQNRFSKSNGEGSRGSSGSPVSRSSNQPASIFSIGKYSKKSSQSAPGVNNPKDPASSDKDLKMFSLPPIFVSQGIDLMTHRICDLPSGLY